MSKKFANLKIKVFLVANSQENVRNSGKSRKFLALKYLDCIIQKTSNEVNALSRVLPFMSFPRKRILTSSFFKAILEEG